MEKVQQDMISAATVQRISIQTLSDRTGFDRKTISGIVNGETENPKIETLAAIAKVLGGEITFSTADSRTAITTGDISYYRTMIRNLQDLVNYKNKWLFYLFVTCIVLIAVNVIFGLVALMVVSKL